MGVNGEALRLHVVYKKKNTFFNTSYAKTLIVRTTSHATICIRYYKSHVLRLTVQ